jgi:hypothetical protein
VRPAWLAQHSRWTEGPASSLTPRVSQSSADYASPVTRYAHERSWLASDAVIAAILVGVILWFCFGSVLS